MAKTLRRRRKAGGKCKRCGIFTQVTICVCNGLVWLFSIGFFCFGVAIGLYSKTTGISEDFNYLDWFITTPATIFIFYGIVLFIVGISGCFASVSGNCCCMIFYAILIVGFIAFDVVLGMSFAYALDSYDSFIGDMKNSQNGFMQNDTPLFGAIPYYTPTIMWNHLQTKGKCCGLKTYKEWRYSTFGKNMSSLPDSCCKHYFEGCGANFFDPDEEDDEGEWQKMIDDGPAKKDQVELNINSKGCLWIFPSVVHNDTSHAVDYTGKSIVAMLLLCFILSIVLIFLVACKVFKPAQGLTNPEFLRSPISPQCRLPTPKRRSKKGRRVHPQEPELEPMPTSTTVIDAEEQTDLPNNNNPSTFTKDQIPKDMPGSNSVSPENNSERRVSFDDRGPVIVPPTRLNIIDI